MPYHPKSCFFCIQTNNIKQCVVGSFSACRQEEQEAEARSAGRGGSDHGGGKAQTEPVPTEAGHLIA